MITGGNLNRTYDESLILADAIAKDLPPEFV